MPLTRQHALIKNQTIGSSDIATLLGESPFAQPMDLYRRLIGDKPVTADDLVSEDDPRFLGAEMEVVVRERYARRLHEYLALGPEERLDVVPYDEPLVMDDPWTFISSAPDSAVFLNGDRVRSAEFKVLFFADRREWGDEHTDDVPTYYLLQCHHHMLVADTLVCDLFVWFGRSDFRHYVIERDFEMDALIKSACKRFIEEHVWKNEPPGLKYAHRNTKALLTELYPGTNGEIIEMPAELVPVHDALQLLQKKRLGLEKAIEALKNEIADAAGESSLMYIPGREKGAWVRQLQKRKETFIPASESLVMRFSDRKERKE